MPSKSRRCANMKPSLRAQGTLKDVAKVVGVSHTAVSNAFNRPDQLSTKLCESVLAAARSITILARIRPRGCSGSASSRPLLLCGHPWLTPLKVRPGCPSFRSGRRMCRAKSQLASFAGRGHGWRCERLRRNKSNIMSEHLDTHLKDMSDHMQVHVFYPFAFGKCNLPETSVFTTGSAR